MTSFLYGLALVALLTAPAAWAVKFAKRQRGAAVLLDDILTHGRVSLDTWEPDYGRLAEAQVKWEAAHGRRLAGDAQ